LKEPRAEPVGGLYPRPERTGLDDAFGKCPLRSPIASLVADRNEDRCQPSLPPVRPPSESRTPAPGQIPRSKKRGDNSRLRAMSSRDCVRNAAFKYENAPTSSARRLSRWRALPQSAFHRSPARVCRDLTATCNGRIGGAQPSQSHRPARYTLNWGEPRILSGGFTARRQPY
jgi:hypothetical protein